MLRGMLVYRTRLTEALSSFFTMTPEKLYKPIIGLCIALWHDISQKRIIWTANNLTYSTLLAFVPILAVVFAIARGFGYSIYIEEWFKEYAKGAIPQERYGKEGELDTTAIFLASAASSYVNGVMIPVDGGYTAI